MQGKTVVLGVTGGIAAYKAAELVSLYKKRGASVYCIMTKNATQFITPLTLETLSGHLVAVDTFAEKPSMDIEHIALAQRADVFVVAPATANIMAKLCHGIADDMLSTTLLATRAPILLAPAMNTGMWDNAATQENLAKLKARGVHIAGPGVGLLACGDIGAGRLIDLPEIVSATQELLTDVQPLAGKRVLVTAGPTREALDPVRYITNHSSGKMGYEIARVAAARGARVTLVTGPSMLTAPSGVQIIPMQSTQELHDTMLARVDEMDMIIMAGAPCDYRPLEVAKHKIKKTDGDLTITFTKTPDVAMAVGNRKKAGQVLVAFAAETQNLLENARIKLTRKNADIVVANDVTLEGAGFNGDDNIATLITKEEEISLPRMSKHEMAGRILDKAMQLQEQK